MLRDEHDRLLSSGLRVVGVSPQGSESHARFRAEHDLPFTLLADVEKETIRAYGVNGPLGFGVRRATFLIGQDGVIQDAVLSDLRIGRHEDFVKRAAK